IADRLQQRQLRRRAGWIAGHLRVRSATLLDNQALGLPVITMQGYQDERAETFTENDPGEPARHLAERPRSYLAYYEDLEAELLAHVHQQDFERAVSAAKRLEDQFGQTESPLIRARLSFAYGIVEYGRRHYLDAAGWFEDALDRFHELGSIRD